MSSSKKTINAFGAAALVAAFVPSVSGLAFALPKEGASAPNAKVEDADGKALQMSTLRGKPILIVYEDRDSAKQNQPLKDDLSKLGKGDTYKAKIALAAIADVSAYDWWPAKGFVKDAIREESKKQKTTIYCDWDGSFGKAFGIRKGVSNVILVGKDGRVLFAGSGVIGSKGRKKLIALLGKEVEGS